MKNNNHDEDESILIASSIREWLTMYIPQVRANSPHTQRAYTITLRLYVEFLESEKSVQHTRLTAQCFDTNVIQDWLLWLKNVRNCTTPLATTDWHVYALSLSILDIPILVFLNRKIKYRK